MIWSGERVIYKQRDRPEQDMLGVYKATLVQKRGRGAEKGSFVRRLFRATPPMMMPNGHELGKGRRRRRKAARYNGSTRVESRCPPGPASSNLRPYVPRSAGLGWPRSPQFPHPGPGPRQVSLALTLFWQTEGCCALVVLGLDWQALALPPSSCTFASLFCK